MPVSRRQKSSGALIFVPTQEESMLVETSKRLVEQSDEMDKKLAKLDKLIKQAEEKVTR